MMHHQDGPGFTPVKSRLPSPRTGMAVRMNPRGNSRQGNDGGIFPWGGNNRGGGGDPFRDTQGKIVTNIRQSAMKNKEGVRESEGVLQSMSKAEYLRMLEDQREAERRSKAARKAELDKTEWW